MGREQTVWADVLLARDARRRRWSWSRVDAVPVGIERVRCMDDSQCGEATLGSY